MEKIVFSKKVFIASSTEAWKAGYIDPIVKILNSNNFESHPWYNEFPNGVIILERLIEITKDMDFAIFFFNEDIESTFREKKIYGTAWNVILEYGMFLQRLSRERVRIIQRGATHIPTDLSGLVVSKIDEITPQLIKKKIEIFTSEIVKNWKHIPPLNNDRFGISKSIVEHKDELEKTLEVIAKNPQKGLKEPLSFDEKLIINFYINGLETVQNKFWTTTYLSSGFWAHKTDGVLSANENLLDKLSKSRSKNIKRLFLIRRDFGLEIDVLRKKIVDYKNRKGGETKLAELKQQFRNLYLSCKLLIEKGCEIRFVYDNGYTESFLDSYIKKDDTEIAIYDDHRVDFFDGGKKGKITAVKIFTNYHRDFSAIVKNAERYFDSLWQDAININTLLESYDATFKYYDNKVDYTIKKLMIFDNDLNVRDASLKLQEMNCVKNFIKLELNHLKISNYLDVGTCTGRYPFSFMSDGILSEDCLVLGYDSDPDCIEYVKVKKTILANNKVNVSNISFVNEDFLFSKNSSSLESKEFNLITCMLGTISHFGWDLNKQVPDSLDIALIKMVSLLSEDGLLIISNWTNNGIDNQMLSIYNSNDVELLKKGTERRNKLQDRLNKFPLFVQVKTVGPDKELDIFFCKKKPSIINKK